ncbi:uncharacterized protein AB675_9571 [Cyphellophora attinorum]|uniref:Uncharacterized protein n=1 Tax=Cyphellophora attinorum TaxID=1664694 RepID=A0A0N0NPC4_9EURO|nr:uncharacterized protein AB675_9571 [Phialophora attinorum]KPI42379.1 hypothetical protein AB675_9571 [Phialophora attinorum]
MRLPSLIARAALLLLTSFAIPISAVDVKHPSTLVLSYEYVSSSTTSTPSQLAIINYDPKSLRYSLTSWTPPTSAPDAKPDETTSTALLRILLPNGSSTVTTLSTFSTALKQHVNLYLSTDGTALSASVTSIKPAPPTPEEAAYQAKVARAKARGKPIPPRPKPEKPKKPKKGTTPTAIPVAQKPVVPEEDIPEGQPRVVFVQEQPGPSPKLLSRAPPVVDADGNEVVRVVEAEKSFYQKYWWVIAGVVLMTLVGGGGGEK